MTSGCIMEDSCPVCGEQVWEDEWDIHYATGQIVHAECKRKRTLASKEIDAAIRLLKANGYEVKQKEAGES